MSMFEVLSKEFDEVQVIDSPNFYGRRMETFLINKRYFWKSCETRLPFGNEVLIVVADFKKSKNQLIYRTFSVNQSILKIKEWMKYETAKNRVKN